MKSVLSRTFSLKLFLVVTLFSYSLAASSKILVISDIDDTLKEANSMGKIGGVYHFLKKVPYFKMRDLFNEINDHYKDDDIKFFYVSAAPEKLFKADQWLNKYHFPKGESFLKTSKQSTYDFKFQTIERIIKAENADQILMFGDNAQVDQLVYNDLKKKYHLDASIYIRDVRTEATYFDKDLSVIRLPDTTYYFSEIELFNSFNFLSSDLLSRVRSAYEDRKLIPHYTLHTLKERLKEACKKLNVVCRRNADHKAIDYWNDYYTRF